MPDRPEAVRRLTAALSDAPAVVEAVSAPGLTMADVVAAVSRVSVPERLAETDSAMADDDSEPVVPRRKRGRP